MSLNYDEQIMNQLLNEPGIKEQVAVMKPEVLEYFIEILVRDGIYAKYVKEQSDKESQDET